MFDWGAYTSGVTNSGTTSFLTTRSLFRLVAFAEAASWAGLLVGMFLKYVTETTEAGVHIFGPIHGGIFVAYVGMCLVAARVFEWRAVTTFWALAAAVPPFATVPFEMIADRRGLLAKPVSAVR